LEGEPGKGGLALPTRLTKQECPVHDPTVSVADILGRPGEYRDLDVRATLAGVRNALAQLHDAPVRARLRVESVVEGVLVTGTVSGDARLECARCLSAHEGRVDVDVCDLFVAPGVETAEEDAYRVADTELHLEPMLRDAMVLALPLNPVCRDDCQGLCARCGADLNHGACDCTDDEIDPRWAALTALRDRLSS
jgi:uncharacterized protein